LSRITITLDTDSAAFENEGEFEYIMRKVRPIDGYKLMDTNGNTVGRVEVNG